MDTDLVFIGALQFQPRTARSPRERGQYLSRGPYVRRVDHQGRVWSCPISRIPVVRDGGKCDLDVHPFAEYHMETSPDYRSHYED